MKKFLLIISLLTTSVVIAQKVLPPDQVYQELFRDVQMSGIFKDSKTFADATPKRDPKKILEDYRRIRSNPAIRFSLPMFITANFYIPDTSAPDRSYSKPTLPIRTHINELWRGLQREADRHIEGSSLLPLPDRYIVPGGRFREVYYWDSYFTMLGLEEDGEIDVIESMISNFAAMIDNYGHIPNGNRSYYLSRSQPPFFAAMVKLLAKHDSKALTKYLPQLEKEYKYWMQPGKSAVKVGNYTVNRYWDDLQKPRQESYAEDIKTAGSTKNAAITYQHLRAAAASGWDFSSRWFADQKNLNTIHTLNIVPVDLNALMYNLEMTIADAYAMKKNTAAVARYKALAEQRKKYLLQYHWNAKDGYFYDHDMKANKQVAVPSLATVYPMFFKMATPAQASAVAKNIQEKFLKPGGLITTLNFSGQQWDAPNGWAPLQWLSIEGLANYGHKELSETIGKRWMQLNVAVYERTGKLMEKYNVTDLSLLAGGGEYPSQDGFGWTNGVLLKLMNRYQFDRKLK